MVVSRGISVRLSQRRRIPLKVSLDCAAGELLALVGPSGSGKTTILRCIAGLTQPEAGSVSCAGEEWWHSQNRRHVPAWRRQVGMVFQEYGLFPHLTAAQNIVTAMGQALSSEQLMRTKELMELVNLSGLESRFPDQLSGGQRQRVALARALARQPRVLLLDEPFSAVDLVTRRKLRKDLARIRQSLKIPIILVTHDIDEAMQLADTLCILHRGVTLQTGPPEQVLHQPNTPLVARLTGQTNIFNGQLASHDEENNLSTIRWNHSLLQVPFQSGFAVGDSLQWMIPQNKIILHQRLRPSNGEAENPLHGRITDLIKLGDMLALEFQTEEVGDEVISFALPIHVAERNGIALGEAVGISLKASGIHCMVRADADLPAVSHRH